MQSKIGELSSQILEAQHAYYNGSEIMSDDEYDALIYELADLDPDNSLLAKIGAEPVKEWKKEQHLIPLGSLNKVNYPHEMSEWLSNTLPDQKIVVVEKLDGLSIGLQYVDGKLVKALLRGNGIEGENILINVLKMKGCVKTVPGFFGTIRGEIVLTKTDHQTYFPSYANPRNAASGLCRRLDGEGCQHLTLMFYQVAGSFPQLLDTEEKIFQFLTQQGFLIPNYKVCNSDIEVNNLWKQYQDTTRASLDYEIDGLVISCDNLKLQQSLGEHNLRPKGKMAMKFANQFVKTTVKEITWSCGNIGRITPICWFEPVNLLGSTVEKASVYNTDYVALLGLDVGAEVLICKANEIIPRVEKVIKSTNSVVETPDNCPECGTLTEMDGKHLICPNMDCPARLLGRLANWIKELNILEWGTSLLTKLVESGKVETVADLYTLTVADLSSLDRMGDKSAQKCYDILHANKEISLEVLLGALSIPLIGQSTIKLIMDSGCDTLEKFGQLDAAQFEQVSGVGPARANSLAEGLKHNQQLILQLLENGVKIKDKIVGKLTGKSICFTGSMVNKRPVLEKMAAEAGATVKNSVGKGLSLLVIADPNSSSSKAVSARRLGTQLVSEEEFMEMVRSKTIKGE